MVISRMRAAVGQCLGLAAAGLLGICLTAGCQQSASDKDYHEKPPLYSRIVRDSTEPGGNIAYRANNPGQAVVFDSTSSHVLYSGSLKPGDKLAFDASTGVVTVGGNATPSPEFIAGHTYKLYWLDDSIPEPDKK